MNKVKKFLSDNKIVVAVACLCLSLILLEIVVLNMKVSKKQNKASNKQELTKVEKKKITHRCG